MATKSLPGLSIRSIPQDLFDAIRLGAALQGQSMETFARAALQAHVFRLAKGPKGAPLAALLDAAVAREKR